MYQLLVSGTVIGLFIQVVPITCLLGVIYAMNRYIKIRNQGLSVVWRTEISRCLFVCYLTGLINLLLTPNNLWTYIWFYIFNGYSGCEVGPLFTFEFNFVPTIAKWLMGELTLGSWVKVMLVGNFLMFVPMGFFMVLENVKRQNILKMAVAIPFVIETLQPIVGRSFDVDDLLFNCVGIVFGYFLAVFIDGLVNKGKK